MSTTAVVQQTSQDIVQRSGLTPAEWRTLSNSLYPGAAPESVLMVIDYCRSRKLDPLKKPCHIVPMQVKDAKTGQYSWRDIVMAGIYELRTTAARTGEYLGHSRAEYGPTIEIQGLTVPEWCEITAYRSTSSGMRAEFPVRLLFVESMGTNKEGKINGRWTKAPVQMLTKCTEAAALREAFPNEVGGEHVAEEMEGRTIIDEAPERPAMPQRRSEQLAAASAPAQPLTGKQDAKPAAAKTPECPKCKGATRLVPAKQGKYSAFYACARGKEACNGTIGAEVWAKEQAKPAEAPAAQQEAAAEPGDDVPIIYTAETFQAAFDAFRKQNENVTMAVMKEQGYATVDELPTGNYGRLSLLETIDAAINQ